MMQSYIDYWKHNKPHPVGLSRIGYRWSVLYNNGTSKEISLLWNLVPDTIRTWILYQRHATGKTLYQIYMERMVMHNTRD